MLETLQQTDEQLLLFLNRIPYALLGQFYVDFYSETDMDSDVCRDLIRFIKKLPSFDKYCDSDRNCSDDYLCRSGLRYPYSSIGRKNAPFESE